MDLTPTAYVVLGMIRLGKTNGYEIKQLVDQSTRLFWAASYGQIYPELKRLEKEIPSILEFVGESYRFRKIVGQQSDNTDSEGPYLRD